MDIKIFNPFKKGISLFLAFFVFLLFSGSAKSENEVDFNSSAKLRLAIVSDIHVESNHIERFQIFTTIFKNLKEIGKNVDAVVTLGDNTMNGQNIESLIYYGLMEKTFPSTPYYPLIGNHDIGNSETNDTYEKLRKRQISYLDCFVDENINELYYSKEVNGYHLIFIGPDAGEVHSRTISDKQLDWLEAEIDKAAESGKPIFVFNHHPSFCIDKNYSRFKDVLTKYDNIYVAVGHLHLDPQCTYIRGKKITPEIWTPCVSLFDESNGKGTASDETGLGFLLEVDDEFVKFKGVNYYTGKMTGKDYIFNLNGNNKIIDDLDFDELIKDFDFMENFKYIALDRIK